MKRLIFWRHAHRETHLGQIDNGLSEKGKKQAERLSEHFVRKFGVDDKPLILSSPRVRCQETVAPLVNRLGVTLEISEIVVEGGDLYSKIEKFESELLVPSGSGKTILACSHGDWIPFFVLQKVGVELDLSKGGWVELAYDAPRDRYVFLSLMQAIDFSLYD